MEPLVSPVALVCPSTISLRRRWLAIPPLRPASRASSLVHSWAVPFWWAALPPLLAISRCFTRSIEANPRSSLATLPSPDSLRWLSPRHIASGRCRSFLEPPIGSQDLHAGRQRHFGSPDGPSVR